MSSLLQYAVFLAVTSGILGVSHYYLHRRLIADPSWRPHVRRRLTVALVLFGVAILPTLVLLRTFPRPAARVAALLVFGWVGLGIVMGLVLVALEPLRLVLRARGWLAARSEPTAPREPPSTMAPPADASPEPAAPAAPADPARRVVLARGLAGVAAIAGVGLTGFGVVGAVGAIQVQRERVRLARLPRAMSGFRIAQLTDVHIGPILERAWLDDVVARTNALEPDLIVITGDLVDGSVDELRDDIAALAGLRARHGVHFVTGNHEYYSGADPWMRELERIGLRVLRNERVSIGEGSESFDLAGVDDWWGGRATPGHGPDLGRALAGRDPDRELVLLAHQPKQVIEAAARGVGLQISGHTHGGQIWPFHAAVRLQQPFVAGLDRLGGTQIYVSRGTGFWGPPVRLGAPAEIALLTLEHGASG